MAQNTKDPETKRLAAEVAQLSAEQREARLTRLLEDEIWPQIPDALRGRKITKAEREEILGYGPGA